MMMPSEALNRHFIFNQVSQPQPQSHQSDIVKTITTHAVRVGNINLLLPAQQVSELVENVQVCGLPNTPIWFNGVTSVRGNMIPVFDLHALFDIQRDTKKRKMIIVGQGDTAVTFWVDKMPHLVNINSEAAMTSSPPMPQMIREHTRNYYFDDDQIWVDWEVDSFFEDIGKRLNS